MQTSNTCAVHDVIMQTMDEKIEDLRQGQREMQSLLKEQHGEIVDNLLTIAKLHREDIKTFKAEISKDLDAAREDWEKKFHALSSEVRKIRTKINYVTVAVLSVGGAAGWLIANYESILRLLGN